MYCVYFRVPSNRAPRHHSQSLQRVGGIDRKGTLVTKPKNIPNTPLVLVSTVSTASNHLKCIIKKHWDILKYDPATKNTFGHRPLFSYKQKKHLKDLVVRAEIIVTKENQHTP